MCIIHDLVQIHFFKCCCRWTSRFYLFLFVYYFVTFVLDVFCVYVSHIEELEFNGYFLVTVFWFIIVTMTTDLHKKQMGSTLQTTVTGEWLLYSLILSFKIFICTSLTNILFFCPTSPCTHPPKNVGDVDIACNTSHGTTAGQSAGLTLRPCPH